MSDQIHNNKENTEFKTLMEYTKILRSGYFNALSAFYAYEGMLEVGDPNIAGEMESMANVAVLNNYKNFLLIAKESMRVYFFIELAKLFDASDQSLHINKIVNFTESNLRSLTAEAFKEYNQSQGRVFLASLVEEFRGVAHSDLLEIKNMLNVNEEALNKLKIYRDKWLAHNDINKPELPAITKEELHSLFDVFGKIVNLITGKLNSESTSWDHIERDTKHHTKMVIEYLRRFEPYRLEEIENMFHGDIKGISVGNKY